MLYSTDIIYTACLRGNIQDRSYRTEIIEQLLPEETERRIHGETLAGMLINLPPADKQFKIIERLHLIAQTNLSTLGQLSWWDINVHEHTLCGYLVHREGQRIHITFSWRRSGGNIRPIVSPKNTSWAPHLNGNASLRARLIIEGDRYRTVKDAFQNWLGQPLTLPTSLL